MKPTKRFEYVAPSFEAVYELIKAASEEYAVVTDDPASLDGMVVHDFAAFITLVANIQAKRLNVSENQSDFDIPNETGYA